ncbi:hypothetical protein [Kitasatospora kifunensis]
MSLPSRRQARAAMEELTDALIDAEVDLDDLSGSWHITPTGTVLIQFRPLHPTEVLQLAEAIRPAEESD